MVNVNQISSKYNLYQQFHATFSPLQAITEIDAKNQHTTTYVSQGPGFLSFGEQSGEASVDQARCKTFGERLVIVANAVQLLEYPRILQVGLVGLHHVSLVIIVVVGCGGGE